MSKLSQHTKDIFRLYERSPKDDASWAKVSPVVWPLLSGVPRKLIECDGNIKDGGFMRLTDKGNIVLEYLF